MQPDPRLAAFLDALDFADCPLHPLAGDASPRKYWRLQTDGGPRVVMDADPATGEDVARFANLSRHLSGCGFSTPEVFAQDSDSGMLLLEDFGDSLFASLLNDNSDIEADLYSVAVDVLLALKPVPTQGLPAYDTAAMADAIDLAFTDYLAPLCDTDVTEIMIEGQATLRAALDRIPPEPPVLCLRDYHAENIFWLPDREGIRRAGLIDFQDAVRAHPAYDLASLLHDVRRDVSDDIQSAMITRYCAGSGADQEEFDFALSALSVQRNLRILGIFARLARTRGKPGYLILLPRVWRQLNKSLRHPHLSDLAALVRRSLPPPDDAVFERLKTR